MNKKRLVNFQDIGNRETETTQNEKDIKNQKINRRPMNYGTTLSSQIHT